MIYKAENKPSTNYAQIFGVKYKMQTEAVKIAFTDFIVEEMCLRNVCKSPAERQGSGL